MKTCPKCQASLNDDAVFCTVCGTKQDAPQNRQPQQGQNMPYTGPGPNGVNQQFAQNGGNPQFQQNYGANPQFTQQNGANPQFMQNGANPQFQQNYGAPQNGNMYQQQFQPSPPPDNRKTYSILSYIGILWLFGLFAAPEKFDARVRFNVGQGIMATIASVALSIVAWILSMIMNVIFRTEVAYGFYVKSPAATAISVILWLAAAGISIFFMVYGIVKVCKNQDTYLPVIGKLAFYK